MKTKEKIEFDPMVTSLAEFTEKIVEFGSLEVNTVKRSGTVATPRKTSS